MKTLLFVLLCLAAVYGFLAWPHLPRRSIAHLTGYDYAHRGLWNDVLPENSLPAFQHAVDNGFGIELDVHLTRDDQLVVFHDDTLMRMCGVDRPICDMTLSELRQLRLKGSEYGIPTLEEVLSVVGGKVPLIVEIKPDKLLDELCAKTCAMLKAYGGPFCVESFHPLAVHWFRKNEPAIIRGQLAYGLGQGRKVNAVNVLVGTLMQNVAGRPDFIAYEAVSDRNAAMGLMRLLRPTLVCWTVHTQQDMDRLRARYDLQIFDGFVPKR